MARTHGPQDFLTFLRTRCPPLARRFDGVLGLAWEGRELRVRVTAGSWCEIELDHWREETGLLAERLFGAGTRVHLEAVAADPLALPLPVASTKVWNHVAFWARGTRQAAAVAVRKPRYLERWTVLAEGPSDDELADPEVFTASYEVPSSLPPGEDADTWLLPGLAEDLCRLGRDAASYVQLLLPFPGDGRAHRLEARLGAVKEWGTPEVPAAILQKYLGRIHYLPPDARPAGVRGAERYLALAGPRE